MYFGGGFFRFVRNLVLLNDEQSEEYDQKETKSVIFVVWTSRFCEDGLHLFNYIND